MRPIVVATDGSASAQAACAEAFALARDLGAPVYLVSVAEDLPVVYDWDTTVAGLEPELRSLERQRAESALRAAAAGAAEAGVECTTDARRGPAGEEICRAAEEAHARFVVVGSRGWGTVGRLVHGSVSTDVLHHATVPVLVVRPPR